MDEEIEDMSFEQIFDNMDDAEEQAPRRFLENDILLTWETFNLQKCSD